MDNLKIVMSTSACLCSSVFKGWRHTAWFQQSCEFTAPYTVHHESHTPGSNPKFAVYVLHDESANWGCDIRQQMWTRENKKKSSVCVIYPPCYSGARTRKKRTEIEAEQLNSWPLTTQCRPLYPHPTNVLMFRLHSKLQTLLFVWV